MKKAPSTKPEKRPLRRAAPPQLPETEKSLPKQPFLKRLLFGEEKLDMTELTKARDVVATRREMKRKDAAKKMEDSVEETLRYMAFPFKHWTRIRTSLSGTVVANGKNGMRKP